MEVRFHSLLRSVLDKCEFPAPQTPYLGERAPATHRIGGWVGLRSYRDGPEIRKFFILAGIRNPDPSTRSDYAVPAAYYFIQM